jgi:hypothetical protein
MNTVTASILRKVTSRKLPAWGIVTSGLVSAKTSESQTMLPFPATRSRPLGHALQRLLYSAHVELAGEARLVSEGNLLSRG